MTTTQIKVTKKKVNEKANAGDKKTSGKTTPASDARVVEMSVKRVKREPAAGAVPAPAAKSRTAVVKTPARRGRSA